MQSFSTRLTVPLEGLLWQTAYTYFGEDLLRDRVVRLLSGFGPVPVRGAREHLECVNVGQDVLRVLSGALGEFAVGQPASDISQRVTLRSCHSRYLADELLAIVPVELLAPALRGCRLESDLGL
jgi:hypothetical protein